MALHPGQAMPIPSNNNQEDIFISGNETSASTGSDASLIAQRLQRQMVAAREREQFSTKAMRDLKTLERQRVYKQATVTIQFPNGIKLVGKFLLGKAVVDARSAEGAGAGVALNKDAKDGKQTTIVSREEALLQRMMGGNPRMGDAASSNSSDASKKATKKPKWFG
ncbi:hypothetical protein MPSEU_000346400 [Mayamaea pseudoterrestris]|nr:hypothetical protein MPSEU_000346400 [Mayamaea pseudoterrestris]